MNILILNWRDIKHPLSGGAEISLFEHAKYWIKQGAKVTWFTSAFPGSKQNEIIDEVQIIRRGSMFTVHLFAMLYYFKNLQSKTDIIFDNFHFIPFFTPLYIRDKVIVAFINEPAREAWFKNVNILIGFIGYILEPLFFIPYRNIPILTGSTSIANELFKYHLKKRLITIVPHGVQYSSISYNPKKSSVPVILYLAQLAPDKGIEDALEMFVRVKKEVPSVLFWIVGRVINEKYLLKVQKIISKVPMKNDIKLFGYVSESKKKQLLEKAWILVHPSSREGWGLNVIEANCFGTPAVGYNISGLSDSIQDKKTGVLTKENNPIELAEEVTILLQDKKRYTVLSRNARQFAKRFSWEQSGEKSWKILQDTYEDYNNE